MHVGSDAHVAHTVTADPPITAANARWGPVSGRLAAIHFWTRRCNLPNRDTVERGDGELTSLMAAIAALPWTTNVERP